MATDVWDALRGPKRLLEEDFAQFRAVADAPAERHKLLSQLFDRVRKSRGRLRTWRRRERRCHSRVRRSAERNLLICRDFSGSDGTRTRDLRRDRPAL
jgi:hypothetical protein